MSWTLGWLLIAVVVGLAGGAALAWAGKPHGNAWHYFLIGFVLPFMLFAAVGLFVDAA